MKGAIKQPETMFVNKSYGEREEGGGVEEKALWCVCVAICSLVLLVRRKRADNRGKEGR